MLTWIKLGLVLAFCAAVGSLYAWRVHVERETGRTEGAAEQATLDDKVIEAQRARIESLAADLSKRDQALATRDTELAACVESSSRQTAGIAAGKAESERLQKASRELARARQDNAAQAAEIASLRTYATAPPRVDRSCADTLKATDDILRRITGK
jgi:hypothetical protein